MKLFIRIVDGQPFEHPIFEDNFKEAFPDVDTNNLPPGFAEFKRIEPPNIGMFEAAELIYGWDGAIVKDVWTVRPMTVDERNQRTTSRTIEINASIEADKVFVQEKINQTTGDVQAIWVAYLAELNAWVLTDVENPNFPAVPFMSITDTGNVPNVIG